MSHLPPTQQQVPKQPFVLNEQTLRQAGVSSLSADQQKRTVVVYDLSDDVSVKQLAEFFGYCGGVEKIVLNSSQGHLFAVVVLEDEAAFSTAVLLNHAILNDSSITVAPYTDYVKSGISFPSFGLSSHSSGSSNSGSGGQSYLDHLQQKRTAYEKMIALVSMGYVKSQDALGELKQKVAELDNQTHDYREQFSTTAKPVVQTTKSTFETANQKIQPLLTTTKEKIDPVTSSVFDAVEAQYEKVKQAEIWENERVKQVAFVGKVAKEEITNVTMSAWNAVRTGWLSLKNDVEADASALRGTSHERTLSTGSPPPVPQHLLENKDNKIDEYFDNSNQSQPTNNDADEFGLPPNYSPSDQQNQQQEDELIKF